MLKIDDKVIIKEQRCMDMYGTIEHIEVMHDEIRLKDEIYYIVKLGNGIVSTFHEKYVILVKPSLNKKAEYTVCNDEQNKRIQNIREAFSDLYNLIEEKCKPGRETSLAITKLEEAQFWAIKGVSREE